MSSLRDGAVVPLGGGVVNVVLWLAELEEETFQNSGTVEIDSRFHALCPQPIVRAVTRGQEVLGEALSLGLPEWSACRSGTVRLR